MNISQPVGYHITLHCAYTTEDAYTTIPPSITAGTKTLFKGISGYPSPETLNFDLLAEAVPPVQPPVNSQQTRRASIYETREQESSN